MELLRLRKIISSTWYFWRLEHGLALVRSLHKPTLWPLPRWEISCCLCLEVLYKLPSDYIFCASYIAGSHQTNLGETAFSNMTPEKKPNVSLRPNLCEMVETRPWILWRPNSATDWLYDPKKVANLLYCFHFSIWESWYFILGTYMKLSYLLILHMCIQKVFWNRNFQCWLQHFQCFQFQVSFLSRLK